MEQPFAHMILISKAEWKRAEIKKKKIALSHQNNNKEKISEANRGIKSYTKD